MAVAACFGGPVLNVLVGTGAPVAAAAMRRGTALPFRRSHANTTLFAETVLPASKSSRSIRAANPRRQAPLLPAAGCGFHAIAWPLCAGVPCCGSSWRICDIVRAMICGGAHRRERRWGCAW